MALAVLDQYKDEMRGKNVACIVRAEIMALPELQRLPDVRSCIEALSTILINFQSLQAL